MQYFLNLLMKGDPFVVAVTVVTIVVIFLIVRWIWSRNKHSRLAKKHFGDDIVERLETKEGEREVLVEQIQKLQEQLGAVNEDIRELDWMRRYHRIPLPAKT
jgi:hypothetical protein